MYLTTGRVFVQKNETASERKKDAKKMTVKFTDRANLHKRRRRRRGKKRGRFWGAGFDNEVNFPCFLRLKASAAQATWNFEGSFCVNARYYV